MVLTVRQYSDNSIHHVRPPRTVAPQAPPRPVRVDVWPSVPACSTPSCSSPSCPPSQTQTHQQLIINRGHSRLTVGNTPNVRRFRCRYRWLTSHPPRQIRNFPLTEFSVFSPSLPPTIISLSSITATPNCSRRPVMFFSIVHLSRRGQ